MKRKYMAFSSFFIALLLLGLFCYGSLTYTGKVSGKAWINTASANNSRVKNVINVKNNKEKQPRFYLRFTEDGEVAVYEKDGETLYEKTGIRKENIPEDEVEKLEKGYAVKNKKELYSILENFSS